MTKSNDPASQFLATGNDNGDVYIFNLGISWINSAKKNKMTNLKAHYKMVRSLSFTEDSTKLLSASDDFSIKLTDINS
jgi:WD40 repeat protein